MLFQDGVNRLSTLSFFSMFSVKGTYDIDVRVFPTIPSQQGQTYVLVQNTGPSWNLVVKTTRAQTEGNLKLKEGKPNLRKGLLSLLEDSKATLLTEPTKTKIEA